MGRRVALLIATYEFTDAGLRWLTAPAADVKSLSAVLADPEIAGFEVKTLVNQPNHVVGPAIGAFYHGRRNEDLTLLYISGHGLKDDFGRLYLAMSNTRRDDLEFTALGAEQINRAIEGCRSRQKILVLDCCYSGAFPAGVGLKADSQVHALEKFKGRGRVVLTSSDAIQFSFEGDAASVFTRYLVQGLGEGAADLNLDGDITVDELYSYVHGHVVEEMPQQEPKMQANVAGPIVIAYNRRWSLPDHLRSALNSPIAAVRLGALNGLDQLYRDGNDIVRRKVVEEFRRLTDDDSREVSAEAAEWQRRLDSPPPPDDKTSPNGGSNAGPSPSTTALDH